MNKTADYYYGYLCGRLMHLNLDADIMDSITALYNSKSPERIHIGVDPAAPGADMTAYVDWKTHLKDQFKKDEAAALNAAISEIPAEYLPAGTKLVDKEEAENESEEDSVEDKDSNESPAKQPEEQNEVEYEKPKTGIKAKLSDMEKRVIVQLRDTGLSWKAIAQDQRVINRTPEAVYQFYHYQELRNNLDQFRTPVIAGLERLSDAEPRKDTPPEVLIEKHNEYAGKRDEGQELTEEDWPDIDAQLRKGANIRRLASDYDVSVTTMDKFIDTHRIAEAKKADALSRNQNKRSFY